MAKLRRSLVEDVRRDEQRVDRLIATMAAAFPNASTAEYERFAPQVPAAIHADDRYVAAAAIAARADVIATHNLQHFPRIAVASLGLRVLSPDEFLGGMAARSPETIVQVIERQAADLHHPPLTIDDILVELARHAPTFVAGIGRRLREGR